MVYFVRHVTVAAAAPQCARDYPTILVVIYGELTNCSQEITGVLSTNSPTKSYPPRGCCTFTPVSSMCVVPRPIILVVIRILFLGLKMTSLRCLQKQFIKKCKLVEFLKIHSVEKKSKYAMYFCSF